MTTFVHLGDLHFWGYAKNPLLYFGKRGLGSANLFLKRSKEFRTELVPLLVEQLKQQQTGTLLFSGDFSTTSLPQEFSSAATHFAPVLSPSVQARAVPGNHDRYTSLDHINRAFENFLLHPLCPTQKAYPFIEHLSPEVACVGFDATTRNGIGSHGLLKPADLKTLAAWWGAHGSTVKQLIVLCHFPPEAPLELLHRHRGQQLRGGEALLALLKEFGIPVLFCHGHYHQRWLWRSELAENVVYLNAGAPLMRSKRHDPDLGFFSVSANPVVERVTLVRCTVQESAATWSEHVIDIPAAGPGIDLRPKVFSGS